MSLIHPYLIQSTREDAWNCMVRSLCLHRAGNAVDAVDRTFMHDCREHLYLTARRHRARAEGKTVRSSKRWHLRVAAFCERLLDPEASVRRLLREGAEEAWCVTERVFGRTCEFFLAEMDLNLAFANLTREAIGVATDDVLHRLGRMIPQRQYD